MFVTCYFILLGVQGTLFGFDEFYYHRARGLPAWERWGHPVDTLSVLVYLICLPFLGPDSFGFLIALGLFSCVCITKDEWVHAARCTAGEHWIHSVLFVLHPFLLFFPGFVWWQHHFVTLQVQGTGANIMGQSLFTLAQPETVPFVLQLLSTVTLFLYQMVFGIGMGGTGKNAARGVEQN